MPLETHPLYVANRPVVTGAARDVVDKFSGATAARVAWADERVVEDAIAAAARAAPEMRRLPAFTRQAALQHVVERVSARREAFARALCAEVGKPIRDARGEVARLIDTFRLGAEECARLYGEYLPLDISPRSTGCAGIVRRVPVGPCSFITAFNFPLNLAAHKIAPAIAAGCPWVLKPAPNTPLSTLLLGDVLAETELPPGAFSIIPCDNETAAPLVADERIAMLSFTGSAAVGWALKARAGRKRVTLELGGNAACIVDAGADLRRAAERITFGAFYQSGQSCISVQRVLAHRSLYAELRAALLERAARLKAGNPLDESTDLGPLISENDAKRVEQWVAEAAAGGAKVLCGGSRSGAFYAATWLENVDPAARVSCGEVFGPVATLAPFDDFDEALALANRSEFGLQAGVFTRDLAHAWRAFDRLEVAGVVINDVPSFRVDSMPYGGVKGSGVGREGVRYALNEMTEPKLLLLSGVDSA